MQHKARLTSFSKPPIPFLQNLGKVKRFLVACKRKGCLLAKGKKIPGGKVKRKPICRGKGTAEGKGHRLGEWLEVVKVNWATGTIGAAATA